MPRFLGIDVGTSGLKAVLIDGEGRLLRQATSEYPLDTPRPGWTQQDPTDWWHAALRALADLGESQPDAIGVTGQMHGAVFLDASSEVLHPAILWNDQRTAEECAEIDHRIGPDRVRAITGNPPLTGFQAPKVLWLRRHHPELFSRLCQVLLPKDYLRLRLTGEAASEVSDASGTGLFDLRARDWSPEMLGGLDLQGLKWPRVTESWIPTGATRDVPGLADGIPVVGGGGDQAAAAVGTGAVEPGIVSVSLGTSGVVFVALPEPAIDPQGRVHTFCHANGGWHAMSVMLACGGAVRWFRDTMGSRTYDEWTALAASTPPGTEGLTFLPYLSGERSPHNDPDLRGAFVGLTLAHGPGHLARAVFEGVTFGLCDGMDALRALGATGTEVRVNGGGAKSDFWLGLLADAFGAPCRRLEIDEGPAFGAAILAGVGVGHWSDVRTAARSAVRLAGEVVPSGVDLAPSLARFRSRLGAARA